MPLDITVVDNHDHPLKSIPIYMDVYVSINLEIKNLVGFELSKNLFSNYFMDYVFYLDYLPILKNELLEIIKIFELKQDIKVVKFLEEFVNLIEYAIISRNLLKAIIKGNL